jgi:hypothetical protein
VGTRSDLSIPKGACLNDKSVKFASDKQTSQAVQFRPNFDRIDREDRAAETAERLREQQEDEEYGRIAKSNPVYRDFSNLISTVGTSSCCLNHTLNSYHYLNDRIAYYQNLLGNLNDAEKSSDSQKEGYQNKSSNPNGVEKLSDLQREEYRNKLNDLKSNRQFLMKNGYTKDEPPCPDAKRAAMTFLYLETDCLSRNPGMEGVASQIKNKIDDLGNLNLSPSNFEQCIQSQADILGQIRSLVNSAWENYHNVQGQESAAPSKLWNYSSKPESYANFFNRMEKPFENDILFRKISRLRPDEFVKV